MDPSNDPQVTPVVSPEEAGVVDAKPEGEEVPVQE